MSRSRRRLRVFLAVLCGAALPGALRAQAGGGDSAAPLRPPGGPTWFPVAGIRLGAPQRLSLYAGATRVLRGRDGYDGVSLVVEPGLGGAQISLARTDAFGPQVMRVQGSVLRTWREPWAAAPGQTFVGAEGRVTVMLVGAGLGGYVRVHGAAPGDAWLLTASLVLGF